VISTWKSTIETATGGTAGIPAWCCSTPTVTTRHTAGSIIDKVPRTHVRLWTGGRVGDRPAGRNQPTLLRGLVSWHDWALWGGLN